MSSKKLSVKGDFSWKNCSRVEVFVIQMNSRFVAGRSWMESESYFEKIYILLKVCKKKN
jgi:hypothetical protein